MKITCKACGTEFEDPRQRKRRNPFCSPLCSTAQALTERLLGNAIIRVNQSSVTCLLCSKELRCASTHFVRVHGITPSRTLTERQEKYGIPEGSRLAPEDFLEEKSKIARKGKFVEFLPSFGERKRARKPVRRGSPGRSAAQLLHTATKFVEAGRVHSRESANAPKVCRTCSRPFRNLRGKKREQKYCSIECRPVHENAIAALKNNAIKMHNEAVARNTIACEWCKREFLPSSRPSRGVRFCSNRCAQAKRRAERPAVACNVDGCHSTLAKYRGMCTKHYQQWRVSQRLQAVVCEWCKVTFETAKRGSAPLARFCSSRCMMKHRYKDHLVALCSADGCSSPVLARGMCSRHYKRQRKGIP